MAKHTLAALVAGVLIAASAAPALSATALRVTLQLPLESHLGQNLLLFKEEVEALSEGEVTVEIVDGAELSSDSELPEAVGSGRIEMGVAPLARYADEVPAVGVFAMPFLLDTQEKVRATVAHDSEVRRVLEEAIADTGAKVLWWQAYGSTVLLSDGGPIATPADMDGKTVRVFSRWLGEWVEAVGGAPRLTSGSEQLLAYERGTVDVGMTGVSSVLARSLWDVMDTITRLDVAAIEFVVVVNTDFWEGLTEQEQLWINEAATRAETSLRDAIAAIEEEAFAQAEANGMTIYDPNPEEVEAWREASRSVVDAWLEEAGALGRQVYEAARNF
ncbi:TRAP transporter substrate-binding protein DctP [Acuticoccus sp.]|uniref:TRAP transporter substrate-binding protein DctP n=1 Tax=Acuticoccus sp. TaxID=1904378 RepID=UPI003B51C55D